MAIKKTTKVAVLSTLAIAITSLVACGGGSDNVTYTPPGSGTGAPTTTPTTTPTLPGGGLAPSGTATSCIPGAASANQTIVIRTVGDDAQGPDYGQPIYPVGTANLAYAFNGAATAFTFTSDNTAASLPIPNSTYNAGTGEVTDGAEPSLADPMTDSLVTFTPSDWPQRLARQLDGQSVGSTATQAVTLQAKGFLPNLLANLNGGSPDPASEALIAHFTVTATRQANATVNGVENACVFSFTMYRPFQWDTSVILSPGQHGSEAAPLVVTDPAVEAAAVSGIDSAGVILGNYSGNTDAMLFLEPYMPALDGSFATADVVPFAALQVNLRHVYGISSMSDPFFQNTSGATNSRAVRSASAPATQSYTYISYTP